MKTLERQLAKYGEYRSERRSPVILDELGEHTAPSARRSTRNRRPWIAAFGAAALVLLLGVMVPLFATGDRNPTTATVAPAPTIDDPTRISETSHETIQTGLGELTWTEYRGEAGTIPVRVEQDKDGDYYGSLWSVNTWHSVDGRAWTTVDDPNPFSTTDWAIADSCPTDVRCEGLYFRSDSGWSEVEYGRASLPQVIATFGDVTVDLPWSSSGMDLVAASDDVAIVTVSANLQIPWAVVYGQADASCITDEACDSGLGTDVLDQVQSDPLGGLEEVTFAVVGFDQLHAELVDNQLTFSHADTGETVLVLSGVDESLLPVLLQSGDNLGGNGYAVSVSGGAAQSVVMPLSPTTILAIPGGGFAAYELDHNWDSELEVSSTEEPPPPYLRHARVWTSADGISWNDHGGVGFVGTDRFDKTPVGYIVDVYEFDGQLIGSITGDNGSGRTGTEYWESPDGLSWNPIDQNHPLASRPGNPEARMSVADFGYVDTAWTDDGHIRIWVSQDGQVWEEVQAPPLADASLGFVGGGSTGAVGVILYWGISAESAHVLWIGHFDPTD